MKYTVIWSASADAESANLWLRSSERSKVSFAAFEIDRTLRVDAHLKGNEISDGLRAINLEPLRFLFSVNDADRIVEIVVVRET